MRRKPTYEELEQRVKELEQEAVDRKVAEQQLQKARDELERRMDERTAELVRTTAELVRANEKLKQEIEERKRAEQTLRKALDGLETVVEERTVAVVKAYRELKQEIEERKRAEEHIRHLNQQLMKAQENERQRLSHDLHDHLAQDLSALKIGLDTLFANQSQEAPETRQRVSELSEMLRGIIFAIRNMAHHLGPAGLDQIGLVQTVLEHCEEFSAKNAIKVDCFATGIDESKLDFDTKVTLYRVVQEGLNNVKKHADAGHATIRLVGSFPNIILCIEDDGQGFDVQNRLIAAVNERRMGLWGMKERVALLQGKMKIESGPMRGTKILIEVPCKGENNGEQENRSNC
jgi:signal transduction histidine kinase